MKPHIEIKTEDTTQYYDFVGDPNDCDEHIVIPSGRNMKIYEHLLGRNKRIRSVVIPSGVREICGYAFTDCSALERVTLRRGVRTIGSYAFRDCERLRHINIPSSVRHVASDAFSGCPNLVVEWHESFIHEDGVVYNADRTRIVWIGKPVDLVIPQGVRGDICFMHCETLRSVVIPDSVDLASDTFYDTCYDSFAYCTSLEEVTLPEGMTIIVNGLFRECPKLRKVNIPRSVRKIYTCAFEGCPEELQHEINTIIKERGIEAVDFYKETYGGE